MNAQCIRSMILSLCSLSLAGCQNQSMTSDIIQPSITPVGSTTLIIDDSDDEMIHGLTKEILDEHQFDRVDIDDIDAIEFDHYQNIVLGFTSLDGGLPPSFAFMLDHVDLGARTIYAYIQDDDHDQDYWKALISHDQPGALIGSCWLMVDPSISIQQWIDQLPLDPLVEPSLSLDQTVSNASVDPTIQQTFYLWDKDNIPATTDYTVNNGNYFDDPSFRPYISSFPVDLNTPIKGAVLICAGGAFQFRSDENEGTPVAQALSALGYQSFLIDYRLRPYTQQEGALDLARAVRFVRAHAEDYGIDANDIAVMGFSAGGILCGEMLVNFDQSVLPSSLDPDYIDDELDCISANAAACGMIYSFYGRLSVATTDADRLRQADLPPTFYCYGTRDPFYEQFLANADALEQAGGNVTWYQMDGFPHGFGAQGGWIETYDQWLKSIFTSN